MTNYHVVFTKTAQDHFKKLDASTRQRVSDRLDWLADNLDDISLEPLRGPLKGNFKFRVGDFRIIFGLDRKRRVIKVRAILHRSKVYKSRW